MGLGVISAEPTRHISPSDMLLFVTLPGLCFPSPFLKHAPFLMSKSI